MNKEIELEGRKVIIQFKPLAVYGTPAIGTQVVRVIDPVVQQLAVNVSESGAVAPPESEAGSSLD
ncbi:hypothetical protein [Methylophilus sp.]|jgi:hypothetical protein|uniref:hypothetical protein n=1 Tax=Methylophilus sp. TaxID=29541 RepID=UPI0011D74BE8|nr:hypothetical protein [Methylophilus sp.]TXI43354.1 MAG: hypothetical protein E6Q52_12630 [Methylophilus sp.]